MVRLRITLKYCLAFYCVIMVYASLHELVHHFAGYLVCGDWGYKSFNYFKTTCDESDNSRFIATYAGPIFSYIMMYIGMWMLNPRNSAYQNHMGFALIFAQLPLQRMYNPFFRMNDEFYASVHVFGDTPWTYWLTIIIIWIICVPPLIRAYKAIQNRRKVLWFLFYLVLFPYLLFGPFFFGLEYLMVEKGVLDQTLIGIGLLFLLNELITVIILFRVKKYIDPLAS